MSVADNATAKRLLQLSVNKDTKEILRVISSSFSSFLFKSLAGRTEGIKRKLNVDCMGNFLSLMYITFNFDP